MIQKTQKPTRQEEKGMFFDITPLRNINHAIPNMTAKDFPQLANAMVLAATLCDTTFTCCHKFLASDTFRIKTDGHWFYIYVRMSVLKQYWNGNSSDSAQVEKLLRYTFGLFAVLSQDPEQHQVLLPDELESALKTANGIMPEYANLSHPMVKAVAGMCSFMD